MGKKRAVPIVSSAYSDDCAPWTIQDLCNWLPVAAEGPGTRSNEIAITVPGLQEFATVPDATRQRGGYVAEGRLFAVVDTSLYQVMPNGSLRLKGTIPGRGRCSFAHNGVTELLIVNGSAGYIYDWTLDTLTQITDTGFPGGILAEYISNLFLIIEPSRRYAQNSALNDGLNWNALETYQGESKPDLIVGHKVANGEYILFGERSTDHFQYTGETNALFQNKLISIDRGAASAHAISLLDEAVFLVGNDGSGYEKRGYSFKRITTHAIEQAWSEHDLSKAFSFVWEDKGHKVWYVTFPDGGHTWGFDLATRKWHRRQSSGMNRWRLAWLQPWNGAWYGGEYNSGRIFRLDWDYHLEGADRITRLCISGVLHDNQNRVTLNEFEPVVEAVGEATTASSVFSLIFDDTQEVVGALTIGGGLPDAAVGDAVNFQYATIGGVSPITFAVTSGTLPAGTTLNAATGAITGTYTTAANNNAWTVTATDALGATATKVEAQYVMDMIGDFADGNTTQAYSDSVSGSMGTAPYTFAKTLGTLPTSLTLSSAGVLSGTATVEALFTFSVTMTDAAGVTQTKEYTVNIQEFVISLAPIAWWKLDEGSGTTLVDSVAARNGSHSASVGGSTVAAYSAAISANSDGSLTCNGSGGQVAANAVFDVATGIGEWTVFCTFQFTNGSAGAIKKRIVGNGNDFSLGRVNWELSLSATDTLTGTYSVSGGTRTAIYATPIALNAKHRACLKRESDGAGGYDIILYLDGTEVDRQAIPSPYLGAFYAGSDGIYFGNGAAPFNPNTSWAGPLSDCILYDQAVSDADIATDATYFAALP
ncbi:MAG: hypothetical protein A3E01_06970 [Gammaproteobacteria bacterium RIFCSPHIGHO2_12_FULL_63_22]|nr:MAG: hypothetical protein A3E01_06970 [Gammaproteobacteria bacterium RIFCSPHIGHO2_12_FULL_63_22]